MMNLIKKHPEILFFGFFTFLFINFGQTILISLLNPYLLRKFDVSRSELANIYALATFLSSLALPFLGKKLDKVRLNFYSFFTVAIFSVGSMFLLFNENIIFLFIGLFLMRLMGQSTLGLTASTTIAKVFGQFRGRAQSIIVLGKNVSESFLPILVISILGVHGLEGAVVFFVISMLLVYLPVSQFLLLKNNNFNTNLYNESEQVLNERKVFLKKNENDFFHDIRFYLLCIANMVLPFVMTAFFYEQYFFSDYKNWSKDLLGISYIGFSFSQIILIIISGYWVDKISAKKVSSYSLIPILCGWLIMRFMGSEYSSVIFLALCGMSIALRSSISLALYAEFFGTHKLGQIKGIDSMMMVLSTSIAPVFITQVIERNIKTDYIINFFIFLILIGILLYSMCSFMIKGKQT
jgi:MFS family permease